MAELNALTLPLETAAAAPWLAGARERIGQAIAAGRLAHALLIQGQPGIGKSVLAEWIAWYALCDRPGAGPCHACASCRFLAAGSHPDYLRIGIPEGKMQVPVEDVRALIGALGLKSHRGGRKVAIIDPADGMNAASANAILKTLEEPTASTLLVLTVARPERLPATVASRCQRLKLAAPATNVALAWLQALDPSVAWAGALALASGAPFHALGLKDAGAVEREMSELPQQLARAETDLVGLAERCQGSYPAERLRWIENWVTERIRKGLASPAPGHTPDQPGLPPTARRRHIQRLYAILDQLRLAQAMLRGPANATMLWERLLIELATELRDVRAALGRPARQ
jgi:DNA polymerase-3 subunit delta'